MSAATDDPVVIVGAARTPMGGFQGELSGAAAACFWRQWAEQMASCDAYSVPQRRPACKTMRPGDCGAGSWQDGMRG